MNMSPTNTMTKPEASVHQPPTSSLNAHIELQSVAPTALRDLPRTLEDERGSSINPAAFLPQPSTSVSIAERWNYPSANVYRTLAIFFAFTIMGANDAAYGVSIT
jgi:hypothetical protein